MMDKIRELCLFCMILSGAHGAARASEATIQVVGEVATVCEVTFGQTATASLSNIDLENEDATASALFGVKCNVPMKGVVSSLNGGLVNLAAREAGYRSADGRGDEVEYDLTIELPGAGEFGPFASDDLVDEQEFDTGDLILFDAEGTLRLDLRPPASMYAGRFTDEIRIEVSPRE